MYKELKFIVASCGIALLVACGGGGGGGGGGGAGGITPNPQTYQASASAGEMIQYTIDRNSLTYSYTVTKSSYGCELTTATCHSGSGTLVKNGDGTYSPTTSLTSKIHVLESGLLYGSVSLNLNGANRTVPIMGIANPAQSVADLAGTYNFISFLCSEKNYGIFTGCTTNQGTVKVNVDGTYATCTGANISTPSPSCTSTTSGVATSLGSGVYALKATLPISGSTTNYMVAFRSPNGQKVGFIDFNDATVYGYGQAVISDAIGVAGTDVAGTYVATSVYGGTGTVTVNPNQTTNTGQTIAFNQPWTGMATVTGGSYGTGYALLAGNGVYVYRNPTIPNSSAYYEVGLRLN